MPANLTAITAANAAVTYPHLPVAVFVGGTSGIGKAIAESFAKYTNGNAHIVLVGRNQVAAQEIIANFPKPTSSEAKHEFVQCDATIMRNVHNATRYLLARLPKLNYLVLSCGYFSIHGRNETEEGIDKRLALQYHARWKFIMDLIPLLQKARGKAEPTKILSIRASWKAKVHDLEDLELEKDYTYPKVDEASSAYNDLMFQQFSERYPSLTFIHAFPGQIVRGTGIMAASDSKRIRLASPLVTGFTYPWSISSVDCGECMLYGMNVVATEEGFYTLDENGEIVPTKGYAGTDEERRKLWEHTKKITSLSAS